MARLGLENRGERLHGGHDVPRGQRIPRAGKSVLRRSGEGGGCKGQGKGGKQGNERLHGRIC